MVRIGRERRAAGDLQPLAGAAGIQAALARCRSAGTRAITLTLRTFISLAGWSAAALILAAYGLLSFGKMQARSWIYQTMNIVGAAGFIINSGYNNAWPSVAL